MGGNFNGGQFQRGANSTGGNFNGGQFQRGAVSARGTFTWGSRSMKLKLKLKLPPIEIKMGIIENESCSTVYVDPKTAFEP